MAQTITIEPVTRIEGHAKVTVQLDDAGRVQQARFHVNEFRGFEKFCEGRLFYEMPLITERICGICPVSHHLASVKACDQIIGQEIPRTASLLRELMHMAQIIQSHSMHFFELAGPDLLLGFDAAPALRNVVGLYQANPDITGKAIRLRKFGQEVIARLGERRVHPNFAVPGGVNCALKAESRDAMLAEVPAMIGFIQEGLAIVKKWAEQHQKELATFASFPTAHMGMVGPGNTLELYDGPIRLVDANRNQIDCFDGRKFQEYIGEHVEPWSYLKFPYFLKLGWPNGVYRVGPLARLNAADRIATPLAQKELEIFRQSAGGAVPQGSLYYHYARLIEDLYAMERLNEILHDEDILSTDIHVTGRITSRVGVGVIEAPRGTLWHQYQVDEDGKLEKVNLLVATGNNNYAMSRAVEEVAREYVHGPEIPEGALNRVEAAIRAYDPCLSCSTHAAGSMPMEMIIHDSRGEILNRIRRA